MWTMFMAAVVTGCAFLYIPGYVILRIMGTCRLSSLCTAPLISIFLFEAAAIVFSLLGVRSSWLSILGTFLFVACLFVVLRLVLNTKGFLSVGLRSISVDFRVAALPFLYLLAGIVVGVYTFVSCMEGSRSRISRLG